MFIYLNTLIYLIIISIMVKNKQYNIKISLWIFILLAMAIWFYWAWFGWTTKTQANPDYICKKAVTWQECRIQSCWEWSTNWTRTCYWERTTEVSYFHIRTSCEAWYTVARTWSTSDANTAARYADQSALSNNYNSWSSWRHSVDYPSQTESCTITQTDTTAPVWSMDIDIN